MINGEVVTDSISSIINRIKRTCLGTEVRDLAKFFDSMDL